MFVFKSTEQVLEGESNNGNTDKKQLDSIMKGYEVAAEIRETYVPLRETRWRKPGNILPSLPVDVYRACAGSQELLRQKLWMIPKHLSDS